MREGGWIFGCGGSGKAVCQSREGDKENRRAQSYTCVFSKTKRSKALTDGPSRKPLPSQGLTAVQVVLHSLMQERFSCWVVLFACSVGQGPALRMSA